MIAITATLATGFAALAPARPRQGWRRPLGWTLLGISLVLALATVGWMGLVAWLGLVPVAAGAILLHRTYRPRPPVAIAVGGLLAFAIAYLA